MWLPPGGGADGEVTAHHLTDGTFRASAATAQCADVDGDGIADLLVALTLDMEGVGPGDLRARAELVVGRETATPGVFEAAAFWNEEYIGEGILRQVPGGRR